MAIFYPRCVNLWKKMLWASLNDTYWLNQSLLFKTIRNFQFWGNCKTESFILYLFNDWKYHLGKEESQVFSQDGNQKPTIRQGYVKNTAFQFFQGTLDWFPVASLYKEGWVHCCQIMARSYKLQVLDCG